MDAGPRHRGQEPLVLGHHAENGCGRISGALGVPGIGSGGPSSRRTSGSARPSRAEIARSRPRTSFVIRESATMSTGHRPAPAWPPGAPRIIAQKLEDGARDRAAGLDRQVRGPSRRTASPSQPAHRSGSEARRPDGTTMAFTRPPPQSAHRAEPGGRRPSAPAGPGPGPDSARTADPACPTSRSIASS